MRTSVCVLAALAASTMLAGWAQANAGSLQAGDSAQGKLVFEKRCTGCHSLTQNREGPHLGGVFGRTAGTVADFAYSAPMKQARFAWDEARLERWLTNPDAVVPGTDMDFSVAKPQERKDLIAYLRTVK